MAETALYYKNIDLRFNELRNALLNPLSNTEMTTLAGTLGVDETGLAVYNIDDDLLYLWDGTQFNNQAGIIDWSSIINIPSTILYSSNSYSNPSWITSLDWSKITGVPSFSTTLSSLTDVSLTGLADKNLLRYNSGTSKWENVALTTLAGYGITDAYTKTELQTSGQSSVDWDNITNVPTFSTTLDGLSDVVITSPTTGQLLRYNGTNWVNSTVTTDNITEGLSNLYFTTLRARQSISESITGIDYDNTSGTFTLTSGYLIPTSTHSTNWTTAYDRSLTGISFNTSDGILTLTKQDASTLTQDLDGRWSLIGHTHTTSDITDWTTAWDTRLALKTTDNLSEGATNKYYLDSRARQAISETITGIDYNNSTGVFSLTSGYVIPTTTQETNWNDAYTNRITSLTTTGSSGAATLISNTLNIPNYTLSGLGGVPTGSITSSGLTMNTSRLLGRTTASSGVVEEIALTTAGSSGSASLSGSNLNIPTYTLAGLGGISLSSLSATLPLSYNNGTGVFSISQANTSTDGYLSSTDWNTFNNKQSTLTLGNLTETTSSVLTITGGTGAIIGSGLTIQVKAASGSQSGYLSSSDWTTFNSKEGAITAGTTSQYWRGDKTWQTLDKTAVGLGNVENTALSTWTGSTNITTLGTIATGTWNATTIGTSKGGTGLTSIGTANQVLGVNSGASGLEYKTLAVGTSGTNFAIAHTANTVTFNLPDASASNRGVVTTGTQTIAGAKTFSSDLIIGTATWGRGGGSRANNITIGVGAGAGTMTTGSTLPNIFIGTQSGAAVVGGYSHIFMGYRAGYQQIGGDDNILIGYRAGQNLTQAYFCIGIGTDVFANLTDSPTVSLNNLAIGHNSSRNLASGAQKNTAYGLFTLGVGTSTGAASHNTAIGEAVLYNCYSGSYNTGVGRNALFLNNGNYNVALGYQAGYNNTGNANVWIGNYNAASHTSVSNNMFFSDGDGNIRARCFSNGNWVFGGTTDLGFKGYVNGTFGTANNITLPADKFMYFGSDYIRTNGARLMTITAFNGVYIPDSLGVGVTPSSWKLEVNGTFKASTSVTTPLLINTGTLTLPTVTSTVVTYKTSTTASSATPTPTGDAWDNRMTITALATNPTFAAPSGTPVDGNTLMIRIKDNGTSRTLAWNAIYRAGTDFALPTATTISKTMYVQFVYNSADSKWDLVGKTDGF